MLFTNNYVSVEFNRSIDIVVPSYRLNEDVLLNIIYLEHPDNFTVHIFIIADNPTVTVSKSLQELYDQQKINLLINKTNLGFSASRNKGIRAGKSKWVILLDDDIHPEPDLLKVYASAVEQYENAIGFVGVTRFPEPFNNTTKALRLSGITAHFESALHVQEMIWAPTANIVLNREKLGNHLFDENLKAGGEDIDFLVCNSLLYNEKYVSVPNAIVTHPWWNNGSIQTERLIRYGIGASEIARKFPVKNYTYRDFTNTSETILLLLLALPVAIVFHKANIILYTTVIVIATEIITNFIKAIMTGKTWSPAIALYLTWIKNCREFGYLYGALSKGYTNGFAQRIELGFKKPHPSPFRLNKWKIIKMVLIMICILLCITI